MCIVYLGQIHNIIVACDTDSGWEIITGRWPKCYFKGNSIENWNDAKLICESLGGKLTEPKNLEEMQAVQSNIKEMIETEGLNYSWYYYWIGIINTNDHFLEKE